MTVTPQIQRLPIRNCILEEESHKYYWDPEGINEEMVISVTGVTNFFKPPYSGPPSAGWRGTHVHRAMEAKANGDPLPNNVSPEGIDCTDWIEVLINLPFWNYVEVLGSEYTMVSRRRGLGGQLDLLVQKEDGSKCLIDLKTKNANWEGPTEKDKISWMTQAGGYLDLLTTGDGAGMPIWVEKAVTLVVTPKKAVWVPGHGESYDMHEVAHLWSDAWLTYLAYQKANPF